MVHPVPDFFSRQFESQHLPLIVCAAYLLAGPSDAKDAFVLLMAAGLCDIVLWCRV